jgi:hypothetical protein
MDPLEFTFYALIAIALVSIIAGVCVPYGASGERRR